MRCILLVDGSESLVCACQIHPLFSKVLLSVDSVLDTKCLSRFRYLVGPLPDGEVTVKTLVRAGFAAATLPVRRLGVFKSLPEGSLLRILDLAFKLRLSVGVGGWTVASRVFHDGGDGGSCAFPMRCGPTTGFSAARIVRPRACRLEKLVGMRLTVVKPATDGVEGPSMRTRRPY